LKLNILITADPEIPVPPILYGGIERIIYDLTKELTVKGHNVILLANKDSKVKCKLVPYKGFSSRSITHTINNSRQLYDIYRKHNIDIVHSFGRLSYLLPILRSGIPKIQTYQRHITNKSIRIAEILGARNLVITACSDNCLNTAKINNFDSFAIHNFVDLNKYSFKKNVKNDAPLVFLGRLDHIKGAHNAIEVAKNTNRQLLIAGNRTKEEKDYFDNEIMSQCDGKIIKYLGPVNDEEKNKLLGTAAALLFPIEWDEPFGIVMAEALACGTPVIAFRRGSVPEVIDHGINGYICENVEEMINFVEKIDGINRTECRKSAELNFSKNVITEKYENLYYSLKK